jgi:hypothetical protein
MNAGVGTEDLDPILDRFITPEDLEAEYSAIEFRIPGYPNKTQLSDIAANII